MPGSACTGERRAGRGEAIESTISGMIRGMSRAASTFASHRHSRRPANPPKRRCSRAMTDGALRERPHHPRVDRAEAEVTRSRRVEGVEEPRHLGGRLVRRQADTGAGEGQAVEHRAQVLPADARADRLAGGPVPHDGRRPLVGADGVDRSTGSSERVPPGKRPPSPSCRTRRDPCRRAGGKAW